MKTFKTIARGSGVVFDESASGEFFAMIHTSDGGIGPRYDYVNAPDPESAIQILTKKHFEECGYCGLRYIGLHCNADDYHKHKKPVAEWSDREKVTVHNGRLTNSSDD